MVLLVDDDVLAVVRSAPTLHVGVDVLVGSALRVGRLADRVFVEREGVMARRHLAAARMLVRPLHGFQFAIDIQLFPGFEQQHLHAVGGKHVRRHPACSPGSYNNRIVDRLEFHLRLFLPA